MFSIWLEPGCVMTLTGNDSFEKATKNPGSCVYHDISVFFSALYENLVNICVLHGFHEGAYLVSKTRNLRFSAIWGSFAVEMRHQGRKRQI